MSEATLAGASHGSGTYLNLGQAALAVFDERAVDAVKFAYNVMETNEGEVAKQIEFALKRMEEILGQALSTGASNSYAEIVVKAKDKIRARRERIVDDFIHGMMGSGKLAKDPIISVVQNQTSSPGGVQQVGFGSFSQSAFTQQQTTLVRAVRDVLGSDEYTKLGTTERDAFKDIADTLVDEAEKPSPDSGKLKRWGSRLIELAGQLGMKVAEGTLTKVLTNIFTGGA